MGFDGGGEGGSWMCIENMGEDIFVTAFLRVAKSAGLRHWPALTRHPSFHCEPSWSFAVTRAILYFGQPLEKCRNFGPTAGYFSQPHRPWFQSILFDSRYFLNAFKREKEKILNLKKIRNNDECAAWWGLHFDLWFFDFKTSTFFTFKFIQK